MKGIRLYPGKATPELSANKPSVTAALTRVKWQRAVYFCTGTLQTGWYHGSYTAFVPVQGRGLYSFLWPFTVNQWIGEHTHAMDRT